MLNSNRGFWKALLFSIITLGFYNWYLIYAFARETNVACFRDGKNTSGLLLFIIFSNITFGIYGIVWHCMWINRCNNYLHANNQPEGLQMSTYLLTVLLLGPLTLGIMSLVVYCNELYLQKAVNRIYNAGIAC